MTIRSAKLITAPLDADGNVDGPVTVEAEYAIDPGPGPGLRCERWTRLEGRMALRPVTRDEAAEFIALYHSTNPQRPAGWRFGVGVERSGVLIGVAWAGNPTGRSPERDVLELQRVAIRIGHNAATMLAGAIARAAKALGFRKLVTYTTLEQDGHSVKAAGFVEDGITRGGGRSPVPRRRWVRELA